MKFSEFFEALNNRKWVIGNLGSNGILLKSQGITIKLDKKNSDALIAALSAGDEVVVKSSNAEDFRFSPNTNGDFIVTYENGEIGVALQKNDIEQIMDLVSDNNPAPNENEI